MTLRVLAGYADGSLNFDTYRALVRYVPIGSLEMVNVTGNVSNYWHEFRKRWTGKYDLMTVEQDNVITAETIPSFNSCPEPWCTYEYVGPPHMGENRMLVNALGCTRFSQRLQKELPIDEISDKEYFSWYLIDYRLAVVLGRKGYEPHVHGEVEHLHNYDENPAQAKKNRQLQEESFNKTRKNPSAVLGHVGLDIGDGIDPDAKTGKQEQEDAILRRN